MKRLLTLAAFAVILYGVNAFNEEHDVTGKVVQTKAAFDAWNAAGKKEASDKNSTAAQIVVVAETEALAAPAKVTDPTPAVETAPVPREVVTVPVSKVVTVPVAKQVTATAPVYDEAPADPFTKTVVLAEEETAEAAEEEGGLGISAPNTFAGWVNLIATIGGLMVALSYTLKSYSHLASLPGQIYNNRFGRVGGILPMTWVSWFIGDYAQAVGNRIASYVGSDRALSRDAQAKKIQAETNQTLVRHGRLADASHQQREIRRLMAMVVAERLEKVNTINAWAKTELDKKPGLKAQQYLSAVLDHTERLRRSYQTEAQEYKA